MSDSVRVPEDVDYDRLLDEWPTLSDQLRTLRDVEFAGDGVACAAFIGSALRGMAHRDRGWRVFEKVGG